MAKKQQVSATRASFPYDKDLVADFKKTFPSARWDRDNRQWVIPGVRSAARYKAWAEAFRSRLLEVSSARSAAEAASRNAALSKLSENPNVSTNLRAGTDGLRLSFPYNAELVRAVRNIPGAHWNNAAKSWVLPFRHVDAATDLAQRIQRVERTKAAEAREEQRRRATEKAETVRRRVAVVPGSVASGQTMTVAGKVVTVEGLGRSFRVGDSFSSLHGSQWLGREGQGAQYAYFREATAPELAAHQQREAAKQASAAALQAERQRVNAVRDAMDKALSDRGVRPAAGQVEPKGRTLLDLQSQNRIYGGGVEYKLHGKTLYRVAGNGADGDDFSRNNFRGTIVDKVKLTKQDVDAMRESSGREKKGSSAVSAQPKPSSVTFFSPSLERHVKALADYDRRIGRDPSVRHGVLAAAGKFEVEELLKTNPAASAAEKAAAYARPFSRATGRIAAAREGGRDAPRPTAPRAPAQPDRVDRQGFAAAPAAKGGPMGFANPEVQAAAQAARAAKGKDATRAKPPKQAGARAKPAATAAAKPPTVAQMRADARALGIVGASRMSRDNLTAAINTAKAGAINPDTKNLVDALDKFGEKPVTARPPAPPAAPPPKAPTVAQMRTEARKLGVVGASTMTKANLNAAIKAAKGGGGLMGFANPDVQAAAQKARAESKPSAAQAAVAKQRTPEQYAKVLDRLRKTDNVAATESVMKAAQKQLGAEGVRAIGSLVRGAPVAKSTPAKDVVKEVVGRHRSMTWSDQYTKRGFTPFSVLGPAALVGASYVAFDAASNAAHASGASKGQAAAAGVGAGAVAAGTVAATGFAIGKGVQAAAALAPTAGRALLRALPAVAAAMALYETGKGAVEGYQKGGAVGAAKGAAMGLADFVTMGGASALANRLSQPTSQPGTLAIARQASGATAARMATAGAMQTGGRRMSADGMQMPDGMTEGYFRQQGGKSVFVQGYKTPDARR